MGEYSCEILASLDRLEKVRDEWNMIKSARTFPLHRWEWFYSAALSFHGGDRLRVLIYRKAGRARAITPLVQEPGKIRGLAFIGISNLHEPCDFVYEDGDALNEAFAGIGNFGVPVHFDRLPLSVATREILGQLRPKGFVIRREVGSSCYLPLGEGGWEEFFGGLPSKKRYDIQRVYRRAEKEARFECEIVAPNRDNVQNFLGQVFRIEAQSWKGAAGSSILANAPLESFFRNYCAFAAEEGFLRIAILSLWGTPASALIGAEFAGSFWVFKLGYSSQWARYSPGVLLVNETIRYIFQKKLKSYEFMGVDEPWIHLWTGRDNLHRHALIAFYPYNLRGALQLAVDGGGYLWRKVSSRIREGRTEKSGKNGRSSQRNNTDV